MSLFRWGARRKSHRLRTFAFTSVIPWAVGKPSQPSGNRDGALAPRINTHPLFRGLVVSITGCELRECADVLRCVPTVAGAVPSGAALDTAALDMRVGFHNTRYLVVVAMSRRMQAFSSITSIGCLAGLLMENICVSAEVREAQYCQPVRGGLPTFVHSADIGSTFAIAD